MPGRLKPFASLRGYQRPWLRGDLLAGLTVWAILVPEALAYASIAGVSPVVGLYAAPAALVFYAAFGSSRHLVAGPMAATAALRGHGGRVRKRRGRLPRDDLGAGDHGRHRGPGRRRAPAGFSRQLHLRAGAERLHRRPRPDDHGRATTQAGRRRRDRRGLLRAALGLHHRSRGDQRHHPRGRRRIVGARPRPTPGRARRARIPRRGGTRDRGGPGLLAG